MQESHSHAGYVNVAKRLKRASGHLQNVIAMVESDRECIDIAQQLHAVERAVAAAKRALVHQHLDHCLDDALQGQPQAVRVAMADFKDITKYL
jgi:DNA-binding FrmR family transcriptional regulator